VDFPSCILFGLDDGNQPRDHPITIVELEGANAACVLETSRTALTIQATIEKLRPVFEAVARGYLNYFDEDLARLIYEPEAYAAAEAEFVEDMKQTGEKQGTPSF